MKIGTSTRRVDSCGVEIKIGNSVVYHEIKKGYTSNQSEDGWGRSVLVPEYTIKDQESKIIGVVKYDCKSTSIIVEFEDFMLGTGNKKESLYRLLNKQQNKLKVI